MMGNFKNIYHDYRSSIPILFKGHNKKQIFKRYLHYEQIPNYLKGNPYIKFGYIIKKSAQSCLLSLFLWNNETLNVWSHIIGFVVLFCLMVYDIIFVMPSLNIASSDYFILACALISYQICMIFSAFYHLFRTISEKVHNSCLRLDLSGILLSFSSVFISGTFFAFDCSKIWQIIYLIILSSIFSMMLYLIWHPKSMSVKFTKLRLVVFSLWALSGVIPSCHWIYSKSGLSSPEVQLLLPNILVMYALSGVAFFFYLTKIPERFYPGKFDFIGSSHQIWHVFILFALLWWHRTGVEYMYFRSSNPCYSS